MGIAAGIFFLSCGGAEERRKRQLGGAISGAKVNVWARRPGSSSCPAAGERKEDGQGSKQRSTPRRGGRAFRSCLPR